MNLGLLFEQSSGLARHVVMLQVDALFIGQRTGAGRERGRGGVGRKNGRGDAALDENLVGIAVHDLGRRRREGTGTCRRSSALAKMTLLSTVPALDHCLTTRCLPASFEPSPSSSAPIWPFSTRARFSYPSLCFFVLFRNKRFQTKKGSLLKKQ